MSETGSEETPRILHYMGYLANLSQELRRIDEGLVLRVKVGDEELGFETRSGNTGSSQEGCGNPKTSVKPSRGEIDSKLQGLGLDPSVIADTYSASGIALKPKKQLGDVWQTYNGVLRELGFTWVRFSAQDKQNTGLWRWTP